MAMEITNNYSSYAAQSVAESSTANSAKKKETEKTTETVESNKGKRTTDYANGLAKLVPSVDFKVGNACSSAKNGKSLTVNPKLLEKMQNDPEKGAYRSILTYHRFCLAFCNNIFRSHQYSKYSWHKSGFADIRVGMVMGLKA